MISYLFGSKLFETPLTRAVIEDDREIIQKFAGFKDQVLAPNELGFNALELAQYLHKPYALKLFGGKIASFQQKCDAVYWPYLKFPSYSFFQKVLKKNSWLLTSGMCGDEQIAFAHIYKEQLQKGYFVDSSIKWINETLEYGVFANRDIQPNEYIGEYVGEVRQLYRLDPRYNPYCIRYPQTPWAITTFTIDALNIGNESRFLNHSYQPNLFLNFAADKGLMHVIFFAKHRIKKGEQLTFNYGEQYWSNKSAPVEI